MASVDETVTYYDHWQAARGLSDALKDLDEIEANKGRLLALRALALPYADHEEFQEAWRA